LRNRRAAAGDAGKAKACGYGFVLGTAHFIIIFIRRVRGEGSIKSFAYVTTAAAEDLHV